MLKDLVMNKYGKIPKTLLILGSGINEFIKNLNNAEVISYEDLFKFRTDKSIGHMGNLHLGYIEDIPLLVMEGRKHYYEGVSDKDMRLMIQSFAEIGVKNLIVTNACGGMNESYKPGDILVITDHINMMGRNPLVGENYHKLGERFVDMSCPYDLEFRETIKKLANKERIDLLEGVYVGYLGPSYETKAEIKAFKILGGDVVGMSTIPEVIIARHASMRVLGLSLITNLSTGISKEELSHKEVLETSKKSLDKLSRLLIDFIKKI